MANSNLPVLGKTSVPSYLAGHVGKLSAVTQAALEGAPSSAPRISIKAGRFRIREGGDEMVLDDLSLDTIIVGVVNAMSKIYYEKQWDPDAEPSQPDCYSVFGDKPAVDAASPQNDICATCEKNQWGSKITPQGSEVKACADTRRISVVSADDPEGTVYLLVIPAASMKHFHKYTKTLASHGLNIEQCITRITFDSEASFPMIHFDFAGYVSEGQWEAVQPRLDSTDVKDSLGLLTSTAAKLRLPAPQQGDGEAQKAKKVKALEEETERDPVPETPPKSKGFGAKAKPSAPAKSAPAQEQTDDKPASRGFGKGNSAGKQKAAPERTVAADPDGEDSGLDALSSELDALINGSSDV